MHVAFLLRTALHLCSGGSHFESQPGATSYCDRVLRGICNQENGRIVPLNVPRPPLPKFRSPKSQFIRRLRTSEVDRASIRYFLTSNLLSISHSLSRFLYLPFVLSPFISFFLSSIVSLFAFLFRPVLVSLVFFSFLPFLLL